MKPNIRMDGSVTSAGGYSTVSHNQVFRVKLVSYIMRNVAP